MVAKLVGNADLDHHVGWGCLSNLVAKVQRCKLACRLCVNQRYGLAL